jgi:hypothetical protein
VINYTINILVYIALIMFVNYLNVTFPMLMDNGSTQCLHELMYFSVILHSGYFGAKVSGLINALKNGDIKL